MKGVKYISAASNPSGYGSAARQFITSLFVAGVPITCETISQMAENTNYGITGNIRKSLEGRDIDHKITICHLTPDLYPNYRENGKYNIGHLFWETDKLPKEWITPCNQMDEIWCGSDEQAEMIKKSGVKTPCYTFSQPIDTTIVYENIKPFAFKHSTDFTFYSIFQWIPRKNPKGLIQAYWKEFEGNDNITLLLKTYRITYLEKEYQIIKQDIETWRKELKQKHFPKIALVHQVFNERDMMRLHSTGDVFIQTSSGEGWSRPTQEAMLLGNLVITTTNGGITDSMPNSFYHAIESHETPVTVSNEIPWYQSGMNWWELDEKSLRMAMRNIYGQKGESSKTKLARQYVIDNFNYLKTGKAMRERLEQI